MSSFVLVHGSFHGAWCWEQVIPRLARAGHRVVAVDLPGRPGNERAVGERTLEAYAAHLRDVVAAEPEPVVLVAHSMGGVIATQAAERIADRLRRIVYVCAFLPVNGQSLLDLAKTDTESRLLPNLLFDEPGGVHAVRPEGAREAFYHDCSDEDAERARVRLVPESLAVIGTPVATSAAGWGRVPRTYVRCTDDRALGPALQARMTAAVPCDVVELASSHSPFYAQPDALVGILTASA